MEPRITTVIPTYRRPKLLPRAIMSVLRQTFPHFEVHVYDNASGDETRQVVERLAATDPRVKYHCHERNIGLVPNFAYGMERVATRFFNLLSDDDLVFPRFFDSAYPRSTGMQTRSSSREQPSGRPPTERSEIFRSGDGATEYISRRRVYSRLSAEVIPISPEPCSGAT